MTMINLKSNHYNSHQITEIKLFKKFLKASRGYSQINSQISAEC